MFPISRLIGKISLYLNFFPIFYVLNKVIDEVPLSGVYIGLILPLRPNLPAQLHYTSEIRCQSFFKLRPLVNFPALLQILKAVDSNRGQPVVRGSHFYVLWRQRFLLTKTTCCSE